MAKDAARVARIVNETVAEGRNSLDLSNCKLTSFPVALFKVMKDVLENIHFISLENNELKSITGDFMTNFNQMRELNLEGNFLKQLPDEVKTLTHLKNINLARNKFSSFPHQLTELTALENINLEANEITGFCIFWPMEEGRRKRKRFNRNLKGKFVSHRWYALYME
ncbi:leucine-rich repeat-containing protein 20-like isoform X2 [Mobula hypostoma]|uniref:leucine-rich repeat-containing protein 20-like isoform X2 n=1 Tax=Mobula hypostoma TaxID=723540 RepID=UPI002FC3093B